MQEEKILFLIILFHKIFLRLICEYKDRTSSDGRVAAQKINFLNVFPLNLLTKQFYAYSSFKNK